MATKTRIILQMDPAEEILLRHKLNKDGEAQQFFTQQVRKFCDEYVPFDEGPLKNTARVGKNKITYIQPYSHYQYNGISKNGKPFNYQHAPKRGKYWDKRMWADRGREVVKSVADFVGGRAK